MSICILPILADNRMQMVITNLLLVPVSSLLSSSGHNKKGMLKCYVSAGKGDSVGFIFVFCHL
jgi:hypothetical protein